MEVYGFPSRPRVRTVRRVFLWNPGRKNASTEGEKVRGKKFELLATVPRVCAVYLDKSRSETGSIVWALPRRVKYSTGPPRTEGGDDS